jgi:uncharacterized Zn finger protein (UPF0148 family)
MSNWYYYDEKGEKIEVTGGQLKGLAKEGLITPETLVETSDGKTGRAGKVQGLTFPEAPSTDVDSHSAVEPASPARSEPVASSPPAVPVAVNSASVYAKDFRCNGCGTPLKIPKNSRGHVVCPACRNECVIEGLVKNAEIAAKENINCGVSLNATPATLHHQLVSLFLGCPYVPLDVFDKIEVVREERHCVPAYIFYCNATASFTYESGTEVVSRVSKGGKITYTQEYTDTQWHGQNGSVSDSLTMLAPGNKLLAESVMELYSNFDFNRMTDVEELEFPPDTDTHKSNLTFPVAFNEYVQPRVEKMLEKKATDTLSGRMIRNLSMGGSNIQKETVRAFLGVYRVVYKYDGQEYSMWATGDGQKVYHDSVPIDFQRKSVYEKKKRKSAYVKKKGLCQEKDLELIPSKGCCGLGCGFIVCLLAAPFTYGISLIGAIICCVLFYKNETQVREHNEQVREHNERQKKGHNEQLAQAKADLAVFETQQSDVLQRMRGGRKALRGIYEGEITDDASVF